jgi:hypothetical protein
MLWNTLTSVESSTVILKPASVKVTNDDVVKVLDFGLAKALEGDPSSIDISTSPTISRMATMQGVLLGTAAYMSPEQAKAKTIDRRADIWAFGCVLYEMLTGKQAFTGETVTDTLASIIKEEPDWKLLPATTSMRVRVLLQRCLQKDPKQRLRDIGDARISLDEVLSGTPDAALAGSLQVTAVPIWRRALPWALFGGMAIAFAALALVHFGQGSPSPGQLLRYEIFPPEKASFGTRVGSNATDFVLSPDGRHLAFSAAMQGGPTQLWVRDLDSLMSRPLPGTDGASSPFWSPDSRALAFQTGSKLEREDISGGGAQVICDVGRLSGGSWNSDGVILFGTYDGLRTVSASGGTSSLLIKAGREPGEYALGYPWFLPDGRHFFYTGPIGSNTAAYVSSLDATGGEQRNPKSLAAGYMVAYAPIPGSASGRILFLQPDGTLMAQPFDASRAEVRGDPVPVAQGVSNFTASSNGVLAYLSGNAVSFQLTWFDRQGKALGTLGDLGVLPIPAISPSGTVVAVSRGDAGGIDLWLYDLAHGTRSRFTFDGKLNQLPVWSSDGSRIAFLSASGQGGPTIQLKAINGMGQQQVLDSKGRPLLDSRCCWPVGSFHQGCHELAGGAEEMTPGTKLGPYEIL